MSAIGLFVLRIAIARPLVRRVDGHEPARAHRSRSRVASARRRSSRSRLPAARDRRVRAALVRRDRRAACRWCAPRRSGAASSTSRSASRCSSLAAGVALWVDRPEREQRSIAELLATGGALAAAAAVLLVPGAAGHAAQTAPRGALARARLDPPRGRLDLARRADRPARALARAAGRAARARASSSPCRASRTSRSSRCCCCSAPGSGRASIAPADARVALGDELRQDDAREDRARSRRRSRSPRSTCCARSPRARGREPRRRRVAAAPARRRRGRCSSPARVVAAALLSSFPPPAKALAQEGGALARVGPGPRRDGRERNGYTLAARGRAEPRRGAERVRAARSRRDGKPVRGADVEGQLRDAGHGDGRAGVPADRDAPGRRTRTPRRRS